MRKLNLNDEQINAILEEMVFNRKMGFTEMASNPPSAEVVIQEVANYYGTDSRKAREMSIFLLRKLTLLRLTEIGTLVNATQSKVIEAIQAVEAELKNGSQETITTAKTIIEQVRRRSENE